MPYTLTIVLYGHCLNTIQFSLVVILIYKYLYTKLMSPYIHQYIIIMYFTYFERLGGTMVNNVLALRF